MIMSALPMEGMRRGADMLHSAVSANESLWWRSTEGRLSRESALMA